MNTELEKERIKLQAEVDQEWAQLKERITDILRITLLGPKEEGDMKLVLYCMGTVVKELLLRRIS